MSSRARFALLLAWGALLLPGATRADSEPAKPEAVLSAAMSAVERGAFDEAIDRLELLADQGFVHRDASLARAYAYVERARSRAAQSGDLGQAVAALEEAALLDPGTDDVEDALETLRSEITRRRGRAGSSEEIQRPALGRAVTALLPENAWATLAALGSALLTLGLALRGFGKRRAFELAGAVGIAAGLVIGTLCGALAASARHYRMTSRPAVVVANEARWRDESGRPVSQPGKQSNTVPEGSLVYVLEERGGRYRIEWGILDGWVDATELRLLATGRPTSE